MKTNPLNFSKGQIWKTNDDAYVSIVSVGKILISYRHSLKPILKGRRSPMGQSVQMEAVHTLEDFLKRKKASLWEEADIA